MRLLTALLAGALFGLGLLVSGMTDTTKVQGFLDLAGAWDPTLAFVMGGGLVPMIFAWRIAERRRRPAFGRAFPAPPGRHVDARLLGGAALFGAGWTLVGLCPGPAMASLGFGGWQGLVFLAAMLAGMALQQGLPGPSAQARPDGTQP